jgi:ATP-dependent protease HslVU (ClpYQ) peptidase subunit
MTICIAAIASVARAIVSVSDTMLANENHSHEYGALKVRPLLNDWAVMFAGTPSTYFSLMRRMNAWLAKRNKPRDVLSMKRAIRAAHDGELENTINETVLLHLGDTRGAFRRSGRQRYPDDVFTRLEGEMKDVAQARANDPYGTELLVWGLDNFGDPHLLFSDSSGKCQDKHEPGFAAIGTGENLAYASLQAHDEFIRSARVGEICYRLQAAKFAAESSVFVGPVQTITYVLLFDKRLYVDYGAQQAREYFNAERARAIPADVLTAIEGSLQGGWVANYT